MSLQERIKKFTKEMIEECLRCNCYSDECYCSDIETCVSKSVDAEFEGVSLE